MLRLNLGNMRPFGLDARPEIVDAVAHNLEDGQAYSDSRGIPVAREAVAEHYRRCGVDAISSEDVFLGNGVSELITLVLQAMVNPGDEILDPAPDYPTWTGAVEPHRRSARAISRTRTTAGTVAGRHRVQVTPAPPRSC